MGQKTCQEQKKLSNFLHKTSKFAGITLMHFCPAIIGWFLLPRARFPKWAVAPFEATWALWAAPILHRFSSAHLVNLRCVKLKIEISVGKWVGAVFEWIGNQSVCIWKKEVFIYIILEHLGSLWILSIIFWPALIMRNFSSGSEKHLSAMFLASLQVQGAVAPDLCIVHSAQ